MNQTVTFTESATPLDLDAVFRASPFVLTGTGVAGVSVYRAQLWRRPQDAREDDAVSLATAYGAPSGGTVSIAFSGTLMDVTLAAGGETYDDLWLALSGVQADGQVVVARAGWLRIIEAGCDPAAFTDTEIELDIVDGTASFTYGGVEYSFPVVSEVVLVGDGGWELSVVDGILILSKDGVSFSVPVVPV